MNDELIVEKFKVVNNRISDLETKVEDIHGLTLAITKVNGTVETLSKDVGEMKSDIKNITNKPSSFIYSVKLTATTAIVTALISALLVQIIK